MIHRIPLRKYNEFPQLKVKCSFPGCENEIIGCFKFPSELMVYKHWIMVEANGDWIPVCCSEHSDVTKLFPF